MLVGERSQCVVSSALMRAIVLVLSLASCWRTEYVYVPKVHKITVRTFAVMPRIVSQFDTDLPP